MALRVLDADQSVMGETVAAGTPFDSAAPFAASANTGVLGLKSLYACTDTGAPRTLTIQSADIARGAPTKPWFFTVKDESGGAAANNITIATQAGELIDGAATALIPVNFGAIRFYSNGSDLFIW